MARHSWFSFLPAVALGVVMLMAGQAKLTPHFTPAVHTELSSHAPDWSRVLPFHPSPSFLLLSIGAVEVVAAVLLLMPWTRRVGALMSAAMMVGAVIVHLLLNEPFMTPAVLTGLAGVVWILSGKGGRGKSKKS
jgi:uncharacterized membrane protein YphA (DoxX/SURF4 family)